MIMSINKVRSALYTLAKLLGDVNAVVKGKVGQRIVRRAVGKCPACGKETKAFRRTRVACKKCCGGKFDPKFLFQWRKVS